MPRRKSNNARPLTAFEIEIMHVLWKGGNCGVAAVQTELGKRFAYTTVQTMLNKLCTKQRVQRIRNGRSYIYSPTISQEAAAQEALNILIDQFGLGSTDNLVAEMIRVGLMTKVQLKNIVHVINGNI
jgi:BlaI family transcriptional regulator, penicillinase repressor